MEAATGVSTRKGEQCKGSYKTSALAETTNMKRLNTRNNTMLSNLIYTCNGDHALRTKETARIQRNRI